MSKLPTLTDIKNGTVNFDEDVPPCPNCGRLLTGAIGRVKCLPLPPGLVDEGLPGGCGWEQQEE